MTKRSWNLIIWISVRSSAPSNTQRRGKHWSWVVNSPATYLEVLCFKLWSGKLRIFLAFFTCFSNTGLYLNLHHDRFSNTRSYLNLHHDRFSNTRSYLNLHHNRFSNTRLYLNLHHNRFLPQMVARDTIQPIWVQTLEIYWTLSLSSPERTYYHLQHKSFSQQRKILNVSVSPIYSFKVSITHAFSTQCS